ncbi:hypothetical protein CTI12_AA143670 [Artemisia annua]|uniref:J domain-containing protein n=1 Tax=Artemisia annua TaxID=35608 RepID=A0A2U1PK65_ARTAN|nr:hypothetical protein CTI12_AA143670 [Artemisia annua]
MDNQFLDDVKGKHIVGYDDLEQSYTKEQSRLVSEILKSYNYMDVLGVTWNPSTKEINNAYTKLSEKVHPNNNKAPGSEEAFKKVEEAYECLSHMGKYLRHKFLHRLAPGAPSACESILALFLFYSIILYFVSPWLTNIPSPSYLLEVDNHYNYSSPIMTKEYGINFYVKSLVEFDEKYLVGTSARAAIENKVINDYIKKVQEFCNDELRWHSKRREFPTPACDMLQTFRTRI